jgi:hypothetical protein
MASSRTGGIPAPGVADIDVSKRLNIPSDSIESVLLDALRDRDRQTLLALNAPSDKSQFEFGRMCGMCQERQAIQLIIEHYLNERDPFSGRHEEN